MTVIDVTKDTATLELRITAEFDAPVDQVWQLWADPRKLERWWGPPTVPATFVDHDLTLGGRAVYFMTGPEGDRHYGWFRFEAVDAPASLRLQLGFGDDTGAPVPDSPFSILDVGVSAAGDRTRMTLTTTFPSAEVMEHVLDMGMEEGMTLAVGQIDDLLVAA